MRKGIGANHVGIVRDERFDLCAGLSEELEPGRRIERDRETLEPVHTHTSTAKLRTLDSNALFCDRFIGEQAGILSFQFGEVLRIFCNSCCSCVITYSILAVRWPYRMRLVRRFCDSAILRFCDSAILRFCDYGLLVGRVARNAFPRSYDNGPIGSTCGLVAGFGRENGIVPAPEV